MARQRLTDKSLRRPPPASGQEELWDDLVPGFGLRIAAGGARTFFVMKRIDGKLVRRTVAKVALTPDGPLGKSELRLAGARARARQMIEAMSRGDDPAAPPPSALSATSPGQKNFRAVAEAYFKDPAKRGGGGLRSRDELERKVRVDLKEWLDRPIAEISRDEIEAVVADKFDKAPVSANRLLALIRRIFRYAARTRAIAVSPAADIDPPYQEQERDRVLSLAEIGRIWAAAEAMGQPYGPLIQLLILTAQRRSEVAEMPWSEIDGAAWCLPDARTKRGKGHLVPLSPRAVSILGGLTKIGAPPTLVFTTGKRAAQKGQKIDKDAPPAPVSGWSRIKTRLDWTIAKRAADESGEAAPAAKDAKGYADWKVMIEAKFGLPAWTLHDIRRSVATRLRDADVMGDDRVDRLVVSKVLNHAESGVTKIYDRYAADPEKRAALEAWALVIERTCGLNVIPIKGKRA